MQQSFNDYDFLNGVSIEMLEVFNKEKEAKKELVTEIITALEESSSFTKTRLGLKQLNLSYLEQKLMASSFLKLYSCCEQLKNRFSKYTQIVKLIKA